MKYLKHLIALLITGGCLYVAFKGVDFRQASKILDADRVRLLSLIIFSSLSLAVFWARAWRWKYFYRREHHATVGGLTVANMIGFMSNNILPLRIGELVRVLMGKRKVPAAPVSYTFATIFIERLLDSLTLLACLTVPLALGNSFPGGLVRIGRIMSIVLAGAVGLIMLMGFVPSLADRIITPVARLVLPGRLEAKFEHMMRTFTQGLEILRDGPAMVKILSLTVFHWGLVIISYWFAFRGFSIDGLPASAPFLTLGLVGLGVALPSAPAFVGPIHYAMIYSLSEVYGVDKSTATGFAVIAHILMMGPVTVTGLILMWREGLSLSQIRSRADHIEEEVPGQESFARGESGPETAETK